MEQELSFPEEKFNAGTLFCKDGDVYEEELIPGSKLPCQPLYHLAESPFCLFTQTWFLKPDTVHTISAVGDAGTTSSVKFSNSTPEDCTNTAETFAVDGLRLEQETAAVFVFKL